MSVIVYFIPEILSSTAVWKYWMMLSKMLSSVKQSRTVLQIGLVGRCSGWKT